MKRNNRLFIMAFILLIAVGFAAVATTLTINGEASVTSNANDFEIYFSSSIIDGISSPNTISQNKKTITFNTKVLTDLNQTSTLEYEITNNSRNYDAEVEIECIDTDTSYKYTSGVTNTHYYSFDTTNTPESIEAMSVSTGSIVVELTNLSTENRSYNFRCDLTVNAKERTSLGQRQNIKLNDYIKNLALTDTTNLMYDNTADNNLRYIGSNPDNYILFNNELWRIIGVFGDNVKIIRDESLGNYSWDSSSNGINNGYGINEWSTSKLFSELNGDYLNANLSEYTSWYNTPFNGANASFDYNNVLSSTAHNMIINATWYTAAPNVFGSTREQEPSGISYLIDRKAADLYINERSDQTGKRCNYSSNCNDDVERTTSTNGYVGLMNISDFAFAAGSTCLNTIVDDYYDTCKSNNWLYMNGAGWTINPFAGEISAFTAIHIYNGSGALNGGVFGATNVHPVVYLNKNVYFANQGDGKHDSPYQIAI